MYNYSLLQKKALFHKTFFSLKRGSVTCMLFIFLFIIDILFTYFLSDLDINSKQVVYICFKILLDRMTNQ